MKLTKVIALSGVLMAGGCGMNMEIDSQTAGWIGAGGGMLLGGWAGSQLGGGTGELIYTGVGAVLGGAMGYETGRSLSMADWEPYKRAIFGALGTSEQEQSWQNAETGTSGYIAANTHFRDGAGRNCQTYRATVAFKDEIVSGDGAACQDNTGNWTLVADAFQ